MEAKMTQFLEVTKTGTDGARRVVGSYEDSPNGRERADRAAFAEMSRRSTAYVTVTRVTRRAQGGQR